MTNGTQTYGIDVSHFNGAIDWNATVKDVNNPAINFCYAKVSQLHKFPDPNTPPSCPDAYFAANWAALAKLQIPRGPYFYCEPYFTAQQMAAEFFAHYTPEHGDLPPFLDIEDEYPDSIESGACTGPENVQQILDFAALISKEIWGAKPLIYIRDDICSALGNPAGFLTYPLWIAAYQSQPPQIPKPWSGYTFWQCSATGTRAGFLPQNGKTNYVDLDWFSGSVTALRALAI